MSEMLAWPVGSRDTTEFPKITSSLAVEFRDHFTNIIAQDGKPWNDVGPFGTPSRFRSYRKMYERLGVIYKDGGKLSATWLGKGIANIKDELLVLQADMIASLRNKIIAVLSRYQFKNPSDKDSASFPADFDIQPCICFWRVMLALDNKISYEEVNRVVLRIMHMADIDAAIEKIKNARTILATNKGANLDEILGPQVITDQPTARIAGLFSQIGWGNLLITGVEDDGYRHLIDAAIPRLKEVVDNPPHFLQTSSEDEWLAYFIGNPDELYVASVVKTMTPEIKQSNVDRLTVALKLFQEVRKAGGPNGWASYDAWAKTARETFSKVDAGMLVAADFDYADFARKFVYNPTVANAYFKDHKEDDKREVGNFISQNRQTPKAASWYLDKGNLPAVKGLGVGCALNFMMKVRPAEFATYSPMIDKALMSVGLLAKPLPDEPTVESYEQSKALQGQVLAKMRELHIGKAADDESAADYLTVNEFAWWLSDEKNKNLVKEKVMSEQLKPVDSKKTVIKGDRALSDAFKADEMLKRLAAALRTKPFAILAGHSGTGKSQLVRRLAYMTCNNQKLIDEGKDKTAPGNYCMVQVKPNWHDSTDLLGYYSDLGTRHFVNTAFVQFLCKAYAYPETPFFLCLDEMNLAPVEQYFAEYLSAVESLEKKGCDWVSDSLIEVVKTGEKDENGNAKVDEEILGQIIAGAQSTEAADWIRKHGLTIPKNLFVVGTVNMDETTCQFSRKVLDRAMTLLMNEVKFAEMGKSVDPSKEPLLDDAGVAFYMQGGRRGRVDAVEAGLLDSLNKPLVNTPFVVAYRFANEYALYEEALANLNGVPQLDSGEADEAKIAEYWKKVSEHAIEALDHVVLMKLLPRIHGMKDVVKGIFEGRKIDEKDVPGLKDEVKADGLSAGMMTEILKRGDEYLTFWP